MHEIYSMNLYNLGRLCLVASSLIAFAAPVVPCLGQGSGYSFIETDYNFGTITEDGGPVRHRFSVLNNGPNPLRLTGVSVSCSCTTAEPNKEPIAVGQTGYVDVAYNPLGRPGSFNRLVAILSDGNPATQQLFLKGVVTPHVKTADQQWPDTLGHGLRMSTLALNMGDVPPTGAAIEMPFLVKNMGKASVGLRGVALPAWLRVRLVPSVLAPGQQGQLFVKYKGKVREDFGNLSDAFTLETTGPLPARQRRAYAVAKVQGISKPLTAPELGKHGHLSLSPDALDYGPAESGKVLTQKIVLENTGKAPVAIYALKARCGCVRTELLASKLKPGQKTDLYIHLDTKGFLGNTTKPLILYSTDEAHPAISINLKANLMPAPGQDLNQVE